jgi:hypothetical protein
MAIGARVKGGGRPCSPICPGARVWLSPALAMVIILLREYCPHIPEIKSIYIHMTITIYDITYICIPSLEIVFFMDFLK